MVLRMVSNELRLIRLHTNFRLTELDIRDDALLLIAPDRLKIEISVPYPGVFRLLFLRLTPWSEAPRPSSRHMFHAHTESDIERDNVNGMDLGAFDFGLRQERAQALEALHSPLPSKIKPIHEGEKSDPTPSPETELPRWMDALWYDDEQVIITSARSRLEIARLPFSLVLYDETGRKVLESASEQAFYMERTASGLSFAAPQGTAFYGLGHGDIEAMEPTLDWRGKKVPIWHDHLPGPSRVILPLIYTSHGAAVLIDQPHPAYVDLAATRNDVWSYETSDGTIDLYIWGAPTIKALLPKYYALFGRQPLPPLWSLGYMQSKFGYRDEEELLRLARTLRQKNMPADVVILDLYWFRHMGDLTFDRRAFPDPKQMIERLRALGLRLIVIEEPYITVHSRNFPFADALALLGKKGDGKTYTFPFWPGEAGLVDFTSPLARRWWADLHRPLMELGIAGWWTDLVEPEVHPTDMVHVDGPAAHVHNTFSLRMHEAIWTAHEEVRPDQRLFIMSRSAWFGAGRYGVGVWSGDVHTSWDHLKKQPALMLSMSLAGFPLWNSDIGGFIGEDPTPELYLRWLQFGIFTPQVRPHGAGSSREPWAFGEEVEALARAMIRLRYRLLPYIYTTAYQLFAEGLPYVRPLTVAFDDPAFFTEGSMYMFGDHVLVKPITEEGQTSFSLRLPNGIWLDLFSRTFYAALDGDQNDDDHSIWSWLPSYKRFHGQEGVHVKRAVGLEEIPLFLKAGALLPTIEPIDHTGALKLETVHLVAVPGNGEGYLYEDDGETIAYQRGAYRLTRFRQIVSDQTITLWIEPLHVPSAPFSNQEKEEKKPHRRWILHWFGAKPENVRVNDERLEGARLSPHASVQGDTLDEKVQRIEHVLDGFYTIDLGTWALDDVHRITLKRS